MYTLTSSSPSRVRAARRRGRGAAFRHCSSASRLTQRRAPAVRARRQYIIGTRVRERARDARAHARSRARGAGQMFDAADDNKWGVSGQAGEKKAQRDCIDKHLEKQPVADPDPNKLEASIERRLDYLGNAYRPYT